MYNKSTKKKQKELVSAHKYRKETVMKITLDVREMVIMILLIALVVLVVYLIVLAANAIKTIKKANEVLDDTKRVSAIAANRTEKVDGAVDEATDMVLSVVDTIRGNTTLIDKVSKIGMGVASAKEFLAKFKNDEEKAYSKRAEDRTEKRKARRSGK